MTSTRKHPLDRLATATWWSDRWAWRGALAAAPAGALAAILHALLVQRTGVEEALVAYAVGAMAAAGIGCLIGGVLGGANAAVRKRRGRTAHEVDRELVGAA